MRSTSPYFYDDYSGDMHSKPIFIPDEDVTLSELLGPPSIELVNDSPDADCGIDENLSLLFPILQDNSLENNVSQKTGGDCFEPNFSIVTEVEGRGAQLLEALTCCSDLYAHPAGILPNLQRKRRTSKAFLFCLLEADALVAGGIQRGGAGEHLQSSSHYSYREHNTNPQVRLASSGLLVPAPCLSANEHTA